MVLSVQTLRRVVSRSSAQLRLRDLVLRVGRANYVVVREDLARRYLQGDGIEIGALDRPLRVRPGVRVRYVDYLDKPGLIKESGADLEAVGIDPQSIVHVDAVDSIDVLSSFGDESVDFLIANHVLEHVENPLAALAHVLRVLRTGGIAMLTLPDARHSFDAARERTSSEHLMRDHREGPEISRTRHYEEWARLIEGQAEADVPGRVAAFTAADARHHFHVWELESFLAFLHTSGLAYELVHAQAYVPEFAVLLAKPTPGTGRPPGDSL